MKGDKTVGAIVLLIIAILVLLVYGQRQDASQQKAFCKRWLQGVSASDSLKLYRARPDCLVRAEDL